MVFESRTAASKSMLNVDVQSKVGSLAVLEEEKVAVAIQKLPLHRGPWVLEVLPQEVRASEVALVAEVAASEAVSNHEAAMEAGVVGALASRGAVASEGKTGMELLLQMLQQARVALVAVDFLGVGEATVDRPVHQIVTALAVGMIRVEVAHMMTEAVEVEVDIVATNVMDLRGVVLEATWSR
jgi:hypothetical protein